MPVREGTRSTFIKYAMRNSWDFALASVAAALRLESGVARDVRIVLGGVAPVPWRSAAAERDVEGGRLDGGDDRVSGTRGNCGRSSARAQRIQGRAGEDARAQRADGARPMIRALRRWFARTEVRLEPRATRAGSRICGRLQSCWSSSAPALPRIRRSPPGSRSIAHGCPRSARTSCSSRSCVARKAGAELRSVSSVRLQADQPGPAKAGHYVRTHCVATIRRFVGGASCGGL